MRCGADGPLQTVGDIGGTAFALADLDCDVENDVAIVGGVGGDSYGRVLLRREESLSMAALLPWGLGPSRLYPRTLMAMASQTSPASISRVKTSQFDGL
jgi:hypothetical protein